MRWPVTCILCSVASAPALGQTFGDWLQHPYEPQRYERRHYSDGAAIYRERYYSRERQQRRLWLDENERPFYWSDLERRRLDDRVRGPESDRVLGPALLDGGPRPRVTPIPPARIAFDSPYPPGSIVIDSAGRRLYLIETPTSALVYPISVGREGFTWLGVETISRIADWPDWHPPAEMRQRDPRLPEKMTGGVRNPLGAKALYLGNTLYRIHGTDDARTIGQATSSGCFRMTNGHVVDLAERVAVGAKVIVVNRVPASVARSTY